MSRNIDKILTLLKKEHPQVKVALSFTNPLEILVSTILSAQCTDVRVNLVTKTLFKKYRAIEDYAKADLKTFEQEVRSTGFYHNKAKNIIAAAQRIIKDFNGKVPDTMEKLMQLPGVARKTANIVLFNGFGKVEGIAVDTHVRRLSQRLGLSKNEDPNKIEQDLMKLLDKKEWGNFSYLLIEHGRKICDAKKPRCLECVLQKLCPSQKRFFIQNKMPKESKNLAFVIQKHKASHLHYDFRLEKDDVLKSWAIPKEPPAEEGIKRLAIQVEDHSLDYGNFEGEIVEGLYGAGKVEIWDKGSYAPFKFEPKEIIFELKGRRLKGTYCLIKLKDKNWLFFKRKNSV